MKGKIVTGLVAVAVVLMLSVGSTLSSATSVKGTVIREKWDIFSTLGIGDLQSGGGSVDSSEFLVLNQNEVLVLADATDTKPKSVEKPKVEPPKPAPKPAPKPKPPKECPFEKGVGPDGKPTDTLPCKPGSKNEIKPRFKQPTYPEA